MSLLPEVKFLLSDPELGVRAFTITRSTGQWIGGRLTIPKDGSATETVNATGVIVPPSPEQLEFYPEGVRREDEKAIYSQTMMHVTEGENVSDTVIWNDDKYKIVRVDRWDEWGFCVAYAVKE